MITTTSEERDDDDLLSRIDIAREKIFEPIKEYNDKMTAATSQVDDLVDSLREQIRGLLLVHILFARLQINITLTKKPELQQQLNNTDAISNELKKEYDERLRNITQNQQESERDEGLRRLENENISRLQQEVDLCEKELEQVENEPLAEDLSDHEQ